MIKVDGTVQSGVKHFVKRIEKYASVFTAATGEELYPGTINIRVAQRIPIQEHFRIVGREIGEPEQDLLFEVCRINGEWAYRIRPFRPLFHDGGHGDNIIEISCAKKLENIDAGSKVVLEFFR